MVKQVFAYYETNYMKRVWLRLRKEAAKDNAQKEIIWHLQYGTRNEAVWKEEATDQEAKE